MKKLDIKRALREHNMTQVELCKRTGLLTQNMSPIINGNPTISKLFQIAEGIGCDITDLSYPDPADEAAEKKEVPAGTENEGETLNATLRGNLPEGFIYRDSRDVKFISETPGEPAYPVHENGLVSENNSQQMTQTSTFCPHCGRKVRVGVVLLPEG